MNKIIMITGATSGFGRATAIKFAKNGFDIIITGRRKERLDELEKELAGFGVKVLSLNFDVRKKAEVEKTISDIPEKWKNIDILVNNAGMAAGLAHIDKGDIDDWERMIDTNLKGLLYVTWNVAPLMVRRETGHIINIGSIAGRESYENGNVYCATKAAVDALSKCMRIDLYRNNIKVTNIAPGMAETEFSIIRFNGDTKRAHEFYNGVDALTPEDIAEVIYFCVSLPAHVCINDLLISPLQQANVTNVHRKS